MNRGFPEAEFEARTKRAQALMAKHNLGALLLTTEADVRYFTGFLTRFWESPTRVWFVVLPASGKPIAVIPSIGAALMAQTWVDDIRTWRAPSYTDDGVGLLGDTLNEVVGAGRIGVPSGLESHLRMPLADWARLTGGLLGKITDDAQIVSTLRAVKSDAEIGKIAEACNIAARSFARVPEIAQSGVAISQVFRDFQRLALDEGADWVPYLAGGAGPGGYADVISPAHDAPLCAGEVLMLDTGLVRDGYFCDFDRNFSIGPATPDAADAHARLIDAVDAAADIARPGATAADLFHAMDGIVTGGAGGSDTGRLGHGLGMQLTEGLSLIPQDTTPLVPGMVITLEPGIETSEGRMLVHEENIVITDSVPRFLSPRAGPDMVQI
ncbi:peptidase M24 [Sulfitobacter sp. SK012]|uniref:M24 family metallopeptidase n=1 Tax=Sulfitobacter sp. SK012 TaxID=1389005 RepID=UPI000E0BF8FB|nr:Xaa-Pro peptidase family protein [Sulfitobacter sp. SK012]AXI47667.1 peptidase M24 [Sulfitobacter sp. SK012]